MTEVALIPLFRGGEIAGYAIVDAADFDWLNQHRWVAHCSGYARRGAGKRGAHIAMHREILGLTDPDVLGDHINGHKNDNRRCNLRAVDAAANSRNRRPLAGSTSEYLGVTWHRQCRRWQASVKVSGRSYYLGLFDSEDDAGAAVAAFNAERFGVAA